MGGSVTSRAWGATYSRRAASASRHREAQAVHLAGRCPRRAAQDRALERIPRTPDGRGRHGRVRSAGGGCSSLRAGDYDGSVRVLAASSTTACSSAGRRREPRKRQTEPVVSLSLRAVKVCRARSLVQSAMARRIEYPTAVPAAVPQNAQRARYDNSLMPQVCQGAGSLRAVVKSQTEAFTEPVPSQAGSSSCPAMFGGATTRDPVLRRDAGHPRQDENLVSFFLGSMPQSPYPDSVRADQPPAWRRAVASFFEVGTSELAASGSQSSR